MRVVVVGAYGLIGSYVAARLLAGGHDLVGIGRDIVAARRRFPDLSWAKADLGSASVSEWVSLLDHADAVVNCAGALQDSPRDDLNAVHLEGVRKLAEACRIAGVAKFIHLSAAGVAPGGETAFNRTKLAAETALKNEPIDWIILRSGLVIAPAAYGGTALLRGLAGFPFCIPVAYPSSIVQVVSADDVAAAVARCLSPDAPVKRSIDLVHTEKLRFETLILELRRWLGLPRAPIIRLPAFVVRTASLVCDGLAYLDWRSPMRSASLVQLRSGICGDSDAARRDLGLELQSLRDMLNRHPAGVQERWFAKSYFLKPLILAVLFWFWFLSGLIGLVFRFPEAVAVLTMAGIAPVLAKTAVILGSFTDMGLAVAVCFRKTAPRALQGMLLIALAYMAGGTLLRPDLWLDPLGPFLKTIPAALLALSALAIMDER